MFLLEIKPDWLHTDKSFSFPEEYENYQLITLDILQTLTELQGITDKPHHDRKRLTHFHQKMVDQEKKTSITKIPSNITWTCNNIAFIYK